MFDLKKITLLFLSIFLINTTASAQDDALRSDIGMTVFQDDKYKIIFFLTPDDTETIKKWYTSKDTPEIRTTHDIVLNQELSLFMTVSPKDNMTDVNLTYDVMLKFPNGDITEPVGYTLAQGKLAKGILHPARNEIPAIMADAPSDCGEYQFIIDLFDKGKKFKRVIMDFKITEK